MGEQLAESPPVYQGDQPFTFVSYAHEDELAVFEEIRWLQSRGINVWYDAGIGAGSEWSESIARAIKECSHFLYFVSPRSVGSENCRREVNFAIEEQRTILAAFLEETELPDGLRLNLNNRQAIHRRDTNAFRTRLLQAMGQHLPPADGPTSTSEAARTSHSKLPLLAAIGLVTLVAVSLLIYTYVIPGAENGMAAPQVSGLVALLRSMPAAH